MAPTPEAAAVMKVLAAACASGFAFFPAWQHFESADGRDWSRVDSRCVRVQALVGKLTAIEERIKERNKKRFVCMWCSPACSRVAELTRCVACGVVVHRYLPFTWLYPGELECSIAV